MTSLTYSLLKDIASEQALDEGGTNSAKFGERNDRGGDRADHDTIFWYHGMAASIKCLQANSLRSGSPYYHLFGVFSILANYSDGLNKFTR